ncbi:hypothetical protein [Anaeromyxobacter oryzae]|uniref:Uncharacterized protein n=1 Tax=Anaeromyxobacter oryzae TaxID=2918170 RepID=A0ABN6MME0_9BACT|nr:hypothetical protein [Anaeromyxobacter oryzae]BDG02120.1 hypothetical protein AMOR_11160 [Anaeromyxobacter oryzae]
MAQHDDRREGEVRWEKRPAPGTPGKQADPFPEGPGSASKPGDPPVESPQAREAESDGGPGDPGSER